ncbi:MAG: phage late control D family protein [Peptostreptococcaceae bacterium]
MVLTRRAGIKLKYIDKEVELSNELSSLTITDNLSGIIDSIEFVLKNNNNRLLSKENELCNGEKAQFELWTQNWNSVEEGIKIYPLGIYYIDTRSFDNERGTFRAMSIPGGDSQDEVNTKIWGEISLKSLNEEFANKYKISAYFNSKDNPLLKDIKQENEADLSFLKKIAEEEGFNFKINVDKLIMFDIEEYEKKEPKYKLNLNNVTYSIDEETKNLYTRVEIKYKRSKWLDEERAEYSLKDFGIEIPGKVREKTLKINARSKSSDLKKLAKVRLFKENRGRVTLSTTIVDKIDLYSGDVIEVINAGIFSGRYMIKKTTKKLPDLNVKIQAYKIWEK